MLSHITRSAIGSRHILSVSNIDSSLIGAISATDDISFTSSTPNFSAFGARIPRFLGIDRLSYFEKLRDRRKFEADINNRRATEYFEGRKCKKDAQKAAELYELAADAGNTQAMFSIGVMYYCGIGVSAVNRVKAVQYFKAAAINGHPKAQYYYGLCLVDGRGVQQNVTKALRYFRLSAENGYDEAQYCFGRCLFNGFGIHRDYDMAVKYFEMALKQGNAKASFFYGMCMHQGLGLKRDRKEAVQYIKFAASKGLLEAKVIMKVMNQSNKSCKDCDYHVKKKEQQNKDTTDVAPKKLLSNISPPEKKKKEFIDENPPHIIAFEKGSNM